MMVNSYGLSYPISQNKLTESSTSITTIGGNKLSVVKNNSDTAKISEAARSQMSQELEGGDFVNFTDENGMYKLGLMALGNSSSQDWSAKGLNITDESIIAAGKALQDGFQQKVTNSGTSLAGSGALALNKYQIINSSQEVPDWFTKEYENVLSSMDNEEM